MKTYVRLEEERVAEIISLSIEPKELYHPSLIWMDISTMDQQPNVNDIWRDGVFSAPITKAEESIFIASSRLNTEMDLASRTIAPLQDAVDIGIATNTEITHLDEWKRYRVALSRIDLSKTPDIEWPIQP
ncbi:tail fiber assembly protein [Pantoea ananatis]|uniref:tail fiber assembly protein n=1 Tax=Pantoea ananas TaxID=553 RepID=UPI000E286392|nr:tail fiber assembly protein [Pantoea ananatis]REE68487.1 virus tail fiber assembly protein lambda gpK [Pantoea ananatis]BBL29181.1 hypothetical protein PAFU01_06290 [Pantoea ananatis]